ncbi:Uncharacterised protein [Mycolicibacterium fortuitum]|uniref:Uncharacterized protein n=1 Tax=Mycolicibacterium fortuitum TaxID=1766 RepID=A0A378WCC4_MYCFO|nr:Uncharacterised protein [Mycolicibacterium fortuitum]
MIEKQFSEACVLAAKHLLTIADELATSPDDPEANRKAVRDTLAVLEQLASIEPPEPILASLQRIGKDLSTADTVTPDNIREIAHALGNIAQDHTRLDAKGRGNWQ